MGATEVRAGEHQNAFTSLDGVDTLALPSIVLQMIQFGLNPTSVVVYMHIVHAAHTYGGSVVRARTSDVLKATGLARQTFSNALAQLAAFNLVHSTLTDAKGVWQLELLNPETGAAIPDRTPVNFATLPDAVVQEFYGQELVGKWDDKHHRYWCPFAAHSHPCFKVNLAHGTKVHGTWSCSQCRKDGTGKARGDYGGMTQLYERLHIVEPQIAQWRVRDILQGIVSQSEHPHNREWEERAVLEAFASQ
jgi:hypothetical protein